jgi:DNA repair exonuclease SbcCD ATPase subunit/DNA repair exonuclease SbcCD nuclease subunit
MIHNIIHISDIHIRTGDSKKSRYTEYISVFNNLYESIAAQPSIIDKSAIIVITGDMFHDKNRIGPSGIKIAVYLLQKLATLADVIVIRGNHDYRQDHPTEPDMISALMSYDIPNVKYLDTTGVHIHKNIAMGLVAIQETLLYGSTSGINASLPPFPDPSTTNANYKVALFHGTITGCTLQNGTTHTRDGYPIGWFQGYDAILLGDIHLQQVNRATKIMSSNLKLPHTNICNSYKFSTETPWGYPGSLIQQNFGEPIKAHGYIMWNLQNKTIHRYHIKNHYGMIKLKYTGDINTTHIDCIHCSLPISSLPDWFPEYLHIRVQGENINNEILRAITEKLQEFGKTVLTITKKTINVAPVTAGESADTNQIIASEIININSIDTLIDYVNKQIIEQQKTFGNKWINWLKHPESLLVSMNGIPANLLDRINRKVATLEKCSEKYIEEFDKVKSMQMVNGNIKLNKLEWGWILNYRDGNVFNFDKNYKKINVINARNGEGKSNFLEMICIALFGEGFPSRYNTNYSADIVCDKKPDGIMASTSITFTLNNKIYMIERELRNNTCKRSIKFNKIVLSRIEGNDKLVLKQNGCAVNDWINENIGAIDTYLMSAMLSQNADKDFFCMNVKEQKELLDKILSLNHITSLQVLLNESVKYYKDVIELIDTYNDGIKSQKREVETKYVEELNSLRGEVEVVSKSVTDLWNGWNMIPEKKLMDISDIEGFTSQLTEKELRLASFSSQSREEVSNRISEINRKLDGVHVELERFHIFAGLNRNFGNAIGSIESKKTIQELEELLRVHPYYGKYNIYENVQEVEAINSKNLVYANDEDDRELLRKIQEFESWKKVSEERFSGSIDIDEAIVKVENIFNRLLFENKNRPMIVSEYNSKLGDLHRGLLILNKKKEEVSEKRPNKPSRTKEWLAETKKELDSYFDFEEVIESKEFICEAMKKIPILCQSLVGIYEKIKEYEEYIKESSDIAFNPKCDACNKQPWRTKYNKYVLELPGLKNGFNEMLGDLKELEYSGIEGSIDYMDYESYYKTLKECLDEINEGIEKYRLFVNEKGLWTKWDKWDNEYEAIKSEYDELVSSIEAIEKEKKKVEDEMASCSAEIERLSGEMKTLRANREAFAVYKKDLDARSKDADKCMAKLDSNWYRTLHLYRTEIEGYLEWLKKTSLQLERERNEKNEVLEKIKEIEGLRSQAEEMRKIATAYPFWNVWKEEMRREKDMRMRVKELEGIVDGAVSGGPGGSGLAELVEEIKEDSIVLTYLCESFKGYKEWLYKEHIGKLIQRKVNDVLELICDERPLYLEYEWLDKIDTLSWFIRDGASRPVIEKASGFQRFIVSIAMRVAINQIGLNRVRFSELFIDEGFTACDVDNLEKVPDFLRGMLRFYDNIYLATHLEDLKGCADQQVFIKRDNGLSQIQYCDEDALRSVEVAGAGKKKRTGRPPKNKENVVVNT